MIYGLPYKGSKNKLVKKISDLLPSGRITLIMKLRT